MREKVRDKGRLGHILNAIDVLLKNKERYTYDEMDIIKSDLNNCGIQLNRIYRN